MSPLKEEGKEIEQSAHLSNPEDELREGSSKKDSSLSNSNREAVKLLFSDLNEEGFFDAMEASSSPVTELSMETVGDRKDLSTEKLSSSNQIRRQLGVGAIPKTRTTLSKKEPSLRKSRVYFIEAGNLQGLEHVSLKSAHEEISRVAVNNDFSSPQGVLVPLQKTELNQAKNEQVYQAEPYLIVSAETRNISLHKPESSQISYLSCEERDPCSSFQTQSLDDYDLSFNAFRLKKLLVKREDATEAIFKKREMNAQDMGGAAKDVFDDVRIKPFVSRKVDKEELRKFHINAKVNLAALEETKFSDARDLNVGIQNVREETVRSRKEAEKGIRFIPSMIVTSEIQNDVMNFESIKNVVDSFAVANDAVHKAILSIIANIKLYESSCSGNALPQFSQLTKETVDSLFSFTVFINEFLEVSERIIHILLRKMYSLQEDVGLLEASIIHLQSEKEATQNLTDLKNSENAQIIANLRKDMEGFLGRVDGGAEVFLNFKEQLRKLELENFQLKNERQKFFTNFVEEINRAEAEKEQLEQEKEKVKLEKEKEKAQLEKEKQILVVQATRQINSFKKTVSELQKDKVFLLKQKIKILKERNEALKECTRLKALIKKQDLELKDDKELSFP